MQAAIAECPDYRETAYPLDEIYEAMPSMTVGSDDEPEIRATIGELLKGQTEPFFVCSTEY